MVAYTLSVSKAVAFKACSPLCSISTLIAWNTICKACMSRCIYYVLHAARPVHRIRQLRLNLQLQQQQAGFLIRRDRILGTFPAADESCGVDGWRRRLLRVPKRMLPLPTHTDLELVRARQHPVSITDQVFRNICEASDIVWFFPLPRRVKET